METEWAPSKVVSLHRYPVKSMLGEELTDIAVDGRGCDGDRRWSVRTADGLLGSGKAGPRFAALRGLQLLRAAQDAGHVTITFPDGRTLRADDAHAATLVSEHVGQPVTLAPEADVSHFDDGPISMVGLASVQAVAREVGGAADPARYRANVVLDTSTPFAEDQLVGRQVRLGSTVLQVEMALPRCVMVNHETVDLPALPGNLAAVGRVNGACMGVLATVITPGRVSVGDVLALA